jgi:TatA/E family protein of Tat protein translocase
MPNIGPVELIFILAIALIVIGPGKLPEVGASLGKSIREFRKAATDVKDSASLDAPAPAAATAQAAPVTAVPAAAPTPATPAAVTPAAIAPAVPAAPVETAVGVATESDPDSDDS